MDDRIKKYLDMNYTRILKREDDVYYSFIREIEGCMAHGETEAEALENLRISLEMWIEAALENGIPIPVPKEHDPSGKILVRMPRSLHKKLDESAREDGVSLNQYIVHLLSGQYEKARSFKGICK